MASRCTASLPIDHHSAQHIPQYPMLAGDRHRMGLAAAAAAAAALELERASELGLVVRCT